MSNTTDLIEKITRHSAVVGIFGLGYVGLPLALRFLEVGYKVIGFDVDETKIQALKEGKSYIKHIDVTPIAEVGERFEVTNDYKRVEDMDAIIICVPTPLDIHREPDLSYVRLTVEGIAPHLSGGQIISLESTTYPGTTEEELQPRIEAGGLTVGQDFFLVYSPEREDPGNREYSTGTIPKVCGGVTQACLEVGMALYQQVIERMVPVSSARAAEMTKLLENIHRGVNIGLVNELKIVCDRMGIDIYEVIDAAATKPFGFVPYYPGPGLGGHCIPIDPFYLTWKAREYGVNTRFIELAGEVNNAMPEWVVHKVAEALNEHAKPLKGSRILVLGLAYKKNIDDTRESPAAKIISMLFAKGAHVDYSDPFVPVFPAKRDYSFDMTSVPISEKSLAAYDCVVVVTDHDAFDFEQIYAHSQLIVDTRGVYREYADKVVKA